MQAFRARAYSGAAWRREWLACALILLVVAAATEPAIAYEAIEQPTTHYHYDRGVEAIEAGSWALAVDNLKLVVVDEPRNASAHDWLGHAYAQLGNRDLALRHLGQALKLEPRHVGANAHLGLLYARSGDMRRAQRHLDALARWCGKQCPEYQELSTTIKARP